ncbi:MAG: zinc-binding dehydrogenase [Chloroflexota bacterium]|nr:zinc-binding dehydrogenase [Chloroflexota bacterium]
MQGMFFTGNSVVEAINIDKVGPASGEVLLEMKASGVCGSDLKNFRAPKSDKPKQSDLKVPGHEPVGVVAEVGPNVGGLSVGDRVMMHHYTGCLQCSMCLTGYTQMCLVSHEVYGSTEHGGHQEYMLVPAYTCIPMPEGLDFVSAAACSCGTGTAFHAVKRLNPTGLDTVAIFGQGPVGLSATMFAAQLGARVIAVDISSYRLNLAKELGASEVIDSSSHDAEQIIRELTSGEGAECTLDATGIPEVRIQAVDSAKYWGKVCFVGEGNTTTFDVSAQIIHKQLTILGSWTFSQAGLSEVANFVIQRQSPMDKLITHTFQLKEAQKAYDTFISGETGKVILTMN